MQWLDKPPRAKSFKLLDRFDNIPLVSVLAFGLLFSVKGGRAGDLYVLLDAPDQRVTMVPVGEPNLGHIGVVGGTAGSRGPDLASFIHGLTVSWFNLVH